MAVKLRTTRKKQQEQRKRVAAGGGGALGLLTLTALAVRKRRRSKAAQAGVLPTKPQVVTGQGMGAAPTGIDDVTLARKVETHIFRPADAPKGDVDVNAEFGVVFLRGQVDSADQAESLEVAARGVEGVKDVKNLLKHSA
jgi:osmotically-inducible protein OsmY